jgi:IS30 family transposase
MTDVEIYKEYQKSKREGEQIAVLAKRLGMARATLYLAVKRVTEGDKVKLAQCIKNSGLECVWENIYRARAEALPDDRTASTVAELKAIIRGMRKDGFSSAEIGRRLGKHHTTVLSHWN